MLLGDQDKIPGKQKANLFPNVFFTRTISDEDQTDAILPKKRANPFVDDFVSSEEETPTVVIQRKASEDEEDILSSINRLRQESGLEKRMSSDIRTYNPPETFNNFSENSGRFSSLGVTNKVSEVQLQKETVENFKIADIDYKEKQLIEPQAKVVEDPCKETHKPSLREFLKDSLKDNSNQSLKDFLKFTIKEQISTQKEDEFNNQFKNISLFQNTDENFINEVRFSETSKQSFELKQEIENFGRIDIGSITDSTRLQTQDFDDQVRDTNGSYLTIRSDRSRFESELARTKTEKALKSSQKSSLQKVITSSVGSSLSSSIADSNIYNFLISKSYSSFRSMDINSALFLAGILADHAKHPFNIKDNSIKHGNLSPKPKIIIDLFNTLVYCGLKKTKSQNGKKQLVIRNRPFLQFFLESIHEKAELIIFSAANDSEVRRVTKFIDPNNKYFSGAYSKSYCRLNNDGVYIKDISFLSGHEDALIIDQRFSNHRGPISAFVPVKPFNKHNKSDEELLKLCEYLEILLGRKNGSSFRQTNAQILKLDQFLAHFDLRSKLEVS